ncbi:MAG: UDP-N-acetylmuramate dehydrogenase [Bacteroidales bacterium]
MNNITENKSLVDITTFHLPVKARYYCDYSSVEELRGILSSELFKTNKYIHIGEGSNLIFRGDYNGVVLHSTINYITAVEECDDYITLKVGSGVNWDKFVEYCVANNYYGVENMSYIPGEVGASAVQNIGSYGVEVKDLITKVDTISVKELTERTFTNVECEYDYRDSIFKGKLKGEYIVTAVEYKLRKKRGFTLNYAPLKNYSEEDLTLAKLRNIIIDIRKSKLPDPKEIGSVGSFFKNPVVPVAQYQAILAENPTMPSYKVSDTLIKIPAGWLIENVGLKGYRIGGAAVYEKQCLVIVNADNACCEDVINLANHIVDTVKGKFGVTIEPEANLI